LKLKYGLDFYRYQQVNGFRLEDTVDEVNRPSYNTGEQFFKEENIEFLLNYKNNITEDFSLSAGGNLMKNESNFLRAFSGKIPVTDSFFLNAGSPIANESFSRREIQSLYGFMDLAYKEYLFLSVTSRNDWSSALASRFTTNKVSFFYPSVGLSALVSEMIDMPEWMNYLKVRGSWAKLGKDTAPFQTNQTFEFLPNLTTFGLPGTEAPDFIVNSNLKPEISTTSEIGLELRLFKNRFKLDATVYDERTVNQIVRVPSLHQELVFY